MSEIHAQLLEARTYGQNLSSLVLDNTNRQTETNVYNNKYGGHNIPIWWNDFWSTYRNVFSQYNEQQAKDKVFINGRFCTASMNDVKDTIIDILTG